MKMSRADKATGRSAIDTCNRYHSIAVQKYEFPPIRASVKAFIYKGSERFSAGFPYRFPVPVLF